MKKVLLIAWLALYACMLQAQTVNLFDESSIGIGDSIDQVKYQVVYDAEYIYEKKYTKTDTLIGRIEEKMLATAANSIRSICLTDQGIRLLCKLVQMPDKRWMSNSATCVLMQFSKQRTASSA